MKLLLTLLAALAAGSAAAQTSPPNNALQTETMRGVNESLFLVQPVKANEIKGRHVSLSGIAVQVVKTDNLAELVNPFAPENYGSAQENVVHDPITGKAHGLKLFSLEFLIPGSSFA